MEKSYNSNGDLTKNYSATLIAETNFEENISNSISPLSTHTTTDTKKSNGKDVQLSTTIYYTTGTYNKVPYITITKVSAASKLIDTTCKISYTKVRGGYRGVNLATNKWIDKTSAWTSNTGKTVSRSISGVKLDASGGILYSVWGEGYCQIKRGTQTWSFSMKVFEADATLF
ncbi:MAG: hypothetical protein ACLUFN_06400 [Eubacterium sp.]